MNSIAAQRKFLQKLLGEQFDEDRLSDDEHFDEEEKQANIPATSCIVGALAELGNLTPFPRDLMLRHYSIRELLNLACVSDDCFTLVKNHLRTTSILSIKPLCNKICLSNVLCIIGNRRCKHRTIRTISALENYTKSGLVGIQTVYIQTTTRPVNPHNAIYMVDRIADIFQNELRYIITDLNNEAGYVDCVKRLLTNNELSLVQFNVRCSNRDKSLLNFEQFKDRTRWGVDDHSIHSQLKRNKKRQRKFKRFGRPHRKSRFERRLNMRLAA